jgi:glutathione synthase
MRKKILAIQGSKLNKVNIKTDTTLFLAIEAQKRGYKVYYFEPENLSYINGKTTAKCYCLTLFENRIFFYKIDKIFTYLKQM